MRRRSTLISKVNPHSLAPCPREGFLHPAFLPDRIWMCFRTCMNTWRALGWETGRSRGTDRQKHARAGGNASTAKPGKTASHPTSPWETPPQPHAAGTAHELLHRTFLLRNWVFSFSTHMPRAGPASARRWGGRFLPPSPELQAPNCAEQFCACCGAGLLSTCKGAGKQTAQPCPNRSSTRAAPQRAAGQLLPLPQHRERVLYGIPNTPQVITGIKSLFHFTCSTAKNANTRDREVPLYVSCISYLSPWVLFAEHMDKPGRHPNTLNKLYWVMSLI